MSRVFWVQLPVERISDCPLVDGETYRVRLASGELVEATWEQWHGCGAFYVAGEPIDVSAVEVA